MNHSLANSHHQGSAALTVQQPMPLATVVAIALKLRTSIIHVQKVMVAPTALALIIRNLVLLVVISIIGVLSLLK